MFVLPAIFIVILLAWCSFAAIYVNAAHPGAPSRQGTKSKAGSTHPTPTPTPLTVSDSPATLPPALKNQVVSQSHTGHHEIALTFDDGPYPYYTAQILSILQRYQVHATFFCVGKNVQNYPLLVQQEYAAGHAIGNHTWDHADLTRLSRLGIQREITSASTMIQHTIGVSPTLLRPPYGAITVSVRAQIVQLHLIPVMWSVDTRDWQRPGANAIIQAVLIHASDGGIVLMHDGGGNRLQTVAALPSIIEGLRQHGYDLVTVPQLLKDRLA
jgi:peptidoglycan/xylan/chitin deacetylase (PgdA/CDA1 family)